MTARPARTGLFAAVTRPIQQFFKLEAASGILLFAASVLAMVWANSPWGESYRSLFGAQLTLGAGTGETHFSLQALINDGLMTIFFFVVGMEIKRELALGELRTPARALLPLAAALGGMVLPAGIYYLFNRGTAGVAGWAIPMATDIAFCIGVLTVLKKHVSHGLIVFLTALAIFDDIGGILVIAIFYGKGLNLLWLGISLVIAVVAVIAGRAYVTNGLIYGGLLAALWFALHEGGIHSTIAGVILGLAIPAVPRRRSREVLQELHQHTSELVKRTEDAELDGAQILMIEERLEDLEAPLARFIHLLHPYMAFVIMPVFALANSGVAVRGMSADALLGPVMLGAALGLFLGKQLGIFAFSFAMIRGGLAPMPEAGSYGKLYGVGTIGGIGFTVALFIAALAFPTAPELLDQAKVGILAGSLLSGMVGAVILIFTRSWIRTPAPTA